MIHEGPRAGTMQAWARRSDAASDDGGAPPVRRRSADDAPAPRNKGEPLAAVAVTTTVVFDAHAKATLR